MNPVSFGSLYKVYSVSNDTSVQKKGIELLVKHCEDHDIFYKQKVFYNPITNRKLGFKNFINAITTISADSRQDHDIDMLCTNYEIKHDKVTKNGTISKYWNKKPKLSLKA